MFFVCAFCVALQARKVEGRVHYSSWMLPGVIVTDGSNFTRTNADGTFTLDIGSDAVYIYVVTPYGFAAPCPEGIPQFWQEVEGRHWFDFELQPTSASEDYTMLAISEQRVCQILQILEYEGFDANDSKVFPDLVNQATSARIKGLTAGLMLPEKGISATKSFLSELKKQLSKLKIPMYLMLGEGPDNQAFCIGKDLVIAVREPDKQALDFVNTLLAMTPEFPNVLLAWPGQTGALNLPAGRNITMIQEKPGAPIGCEIYSKRGGSLTWLYHSSEYGDDYQAEIIRPGEHRLRPNDFLVKIWDYDSQWNVTWSQDGIPMGPMFLVEPGVLAATPARYAKTATVQIESRFGKKWTLETDLHFTDIQASLNFRNKTIDSFEKELSKINYSIVNSIEMELQLTTDGKVIVIRDAYPKFTSAGGIEVGALIEDIDKYASVKGSSLKRITFAINSGSGAGEGKVWPEYKEFADKCLEVLLSKNLGDRLLIESFDDRVLNYIHKKYPQVELCYLVDTECGSFKDFMSLLDFTPRWIGLQYEMADSALIEQAREAGMLVAIWDVNDVQFIKQLLTARVDSIITDDFDSVLSAQFEIEFMNE